MQSAQILLETISASEKQHFIIKTLCLYIRVYKTVTAFYNRKIDRKYH